MKYLITGAAGFIGSHLANNLLQEGNEVVAVGFAAKDFIFDEKIKFYKTGISDPAIANIFEKEKPEIVCHLAGPINLRRSVNDSLFGLSANFFSDAKKLLDFSYSLGVKKFIFTSSGGALYGRNLPIPTPENVQVYPDSFYGMANLMIEKLITSYYENFFLPYAILRLTNVYGPRQWKEGIIPSIAESITENRSVAINGDGEQTRDFIYVEDAVCALKCASEAETSGIFNVGSGQEITLNSLCEKISRILKKEARIVYCKEKPFGASRSAVDISKIKKEFGWQPAVSLDQGLKKTINRFTAK